ncbi:hypothetical protein CHLRE_12g494000v5 [Chlamydomonas reinhardtii]|uniref:MATH domain-containing protein n=1 Tax=Chlamydomonas reinhardtii TaxID=3055 RepID=A0A2K3D1U9_CHLRE|nr:uncharacterized protein CHLRE_12g494000v5 [Chlamydomonas reinhardtii]PNW74497.1 hypothetical protein CHLRE_12g494000v5 [Chlamydomonas reinhardtii]
MSKVNQSRIREALTAGTNVKEKGPPVADGILSVTPDTPEMLEWRSRSALDVAETSSTFLDDEDDGPKPHELYGKFTWKIENFSEISKRELRSNVFDVGSYKWYILVYPQGCDVCNHLSLFLCVADYDKLLPGWSHFAQFTIAVVNKDPKKSKYSDTLHRFCKKEHDWGWKKFMELSKVLDGFTVADTLVIKAQVQVILDKPSKPFRCLDPQYRRELVRVYLTNVEGICRRFCDDKKARLNWVREEEGAFRHFWGSLTPEQQRKYLTDKGEVILKAVVKQFFNEKEVTSTLVMDALYSGCKQIEEHSRSWLEGKCSDNMSPVVLIKAERNSFTLCGDLMDTAARVLQDYIPAAKDDNKVMQPNDGLTLRSGQDGDDYRRDSIERDEKRLAELGRKTIEMFVISHLFCEKLEVAYREAEALKRQDQLIAEEFEMARLEESKAQAKAMADKEKKAKKKEKLKQKKEAEKLKREAEEAERKAREEEFRRQEAERKAKEAEKKRLEDAQAQPVAQPQPPQQQAHQQQARKAAKAKEDKKALQQQQQALQQQQQQLAKAKQAAQQQQQQQPATNRSAAAASASGPPSLSSIAAAAVVDSAAASASSLPERPGTHDDPSSDSGSEEVGTVNQATGATDSSGDGEDEVEVLASRGMAATAASDSDGDSEGRAALEEEVTILRAQVSQLQRVLVERDSEVYSLRAQLAESHLAQAHLAQQLAAAREVPVASSNARTSGTNTSSSGSAAADGSSVAGREQAGSDGSSSVASAAARPDADRGQGKSDAAANGPKEGLSTSAISSAASAAAGAAGRRMQGNPAAAPAAATHDAALHHGVASRPAAQGASAATAGRGLPAGASGSAAAAGDLGSAGSMMQRSTSATLPSAAPSTATGAASYAPAQLAAATANGRARDAAGASGSATSAPAATGAGAKSFLPAGASSSSTAASGAASSAATSNGISGVLHSGSGGAAAPAQDGLPSYRNAAAGVLATGQPSGSAAAPAMVSVSTAPVIPASASAAAAGVQSKRADEGASATAPAARLGVSAPSTDGFSATNARIIMQQAQQQRSSNMAFSTPTPVPSSAAKQRMTASAQMDSPGLEDFAHINMIDDLLTE